ncbi:Metastasis suppressor protein 1 [Trichinella patagoniensis]|uniref:Metastasis suppressor protein 1 n=1 Tax=Trichinella patagoniensis TaxID=990121 RepID=A0A0V0ZKM2_9BILA|nr:Metastasis suppressor protein 1 [Trichinella patagoniensis]
MDCSLEKESNALAGLFQNIICDLKGGQAVWDDLIQKTVKFSGQMKLTIGAVSGFIEALQRVADMATAAKGATREIGSTLTRLCIRHREVEEHLKKLTNSLIHCLATPLQERMDDWRRVVIQMDRDHGKEFKRNRNEIRKRIGDKLRLQKKLRKGSLSMQSMVDTVVNDIKNRSNVLLSAEQQSLRQAMIEQRAQFCYFISCFKPIMVSCRLFIIIISIGMVMMVIIQDEELALLGEIAHMQELVEQLCRLTADPYTLPAASEAVIIDVKGLENTWRFQTPPSSPGSSYGSRKSSFCSLTSVETINNQPMAIAMANNSSVSATESNATATITTTNANATATANNNNSNNASSTTVHANDKKYGKFTRHSSAISEDSGFLSRDSLVPTASCFRNTLAAAQLKNILSDDDPEVASTGPEEEDSQQSTPSPSPSLATWPDGSRSGSLACHEQGQPKPTVPTDAGDRPHTISAGFTDAHQTLLHRRPPIDESVFCRNGAGVKIKANNARVSACFGSFVPRQKPPLPPRVSSVSSSAAPRTYQQRSNSQARAEQPVYCNLPTCPAPADVTVGRRPLSYAGGTTNSNSHPTHTSSFTGRPLFPRSTKTAAETEEDTLIHECLDEIDQLSSDLDRYATTKRVDVRSTGVVANPSFKSFCTMSRMVGMMRKETDGVDAQLKSRNLTKIDESVEAQEPSSQSVVFPSPDVPSPPPPPPPRQLLTHSSDSEISQKIVSTRPTLALSPPTPPPFPDFLKKSSQKAGSSKTDEVNGSFTTLSIGSYQQTEQMMVMKRRSYIGRAPPPPPPIRRNSEITSATVRAPPVDLVRCGSRCTTPIEETYSSVICALNARLAAVASSSTQHGQSAVPAGHGMVENHYHHLQQHQQQHHHHHRRHSERVDVETTESAESTSTTISRTLQNTFYSLPCNDCSPRVVQVAQFNGDIGINRV